MKKKWEGKHMCPVCGQTEFDAPFSNDICFVCGWEDDVMEEGAPTGANEMELDEYRAAYQSGWLPDWIKEERGLI